MTSENSSNVRVLASPSSWIESSAVDQCHAVAALPGMESVAGMADLHPGKAAPIGCAALSRTLYPHLVGSDIGCGIGVWPLTVKKADPERMARRIVDLDAEIDDDDPALDGLDPQIWARHRHGLGTTGRGNHFAEIARVEVPGGEGACADLHATSLRGLAAGDLVLIVHSGSRGLGESILRDHTERRGNGPSADPDDYLAAHDEAVRWAATNRLVIARRVADSLHARLGEQLLDHEHNSVEVRDGRFLHRKGAAPGDAGLVLVAGTRGTRSFIVDGGAGPAANWSLPHGAGRKRSRRDAFARSEATSSAAELRRTPVGSIVVCGDRQLLFEEAPDAYKRIETVIDDLVAFEQGRVVCATVPVVTYKTADRDSEGSRRREREQAARRRTEQRRPKGRGRDRGRR